MNEPSSAATSQIVRVRLRDHGPVVCFTAAPEQVQPGAICIVNFDRGQDYGKVIALDVDAGEDLPERQTVVRLCQPGDVRRIEQNRRDALQQIEPCREEIAAHKLAMKVIGAEYTFDRSKIVFYFAADARVDFRALVRDLARRLRIRIELYQIGVRDETKLLGAIACCGRIVCCRSWLYDFMPVNIRMAKQQQLQLHPAKLAGVCNRLKCCLAYECEAYRELQSQMPQRGQRVRTPTGTGDVLDVALLLRQVTVRMDDESVQTFPADAVTIVSRSKARAKVRARRRRLRAADEPGAAERRESRAPRGTRGPRPARPPRTAPSSASTPNATS
jgi:cell fate regulator YaaT (PSP1 superfamily)